MRDYDDYLDDELEEELEKEIPKKKGKFKYFFGFTVLATAVGVTVWAGKTGKLDKYLDKYIKNKTDLGKIESSEIEDTLPLDQNGVISITFPVVNRTLDEPAGLYSLPSGYTPYYVATEDTTYTDLTIVSDTTKRGENVENYQSNSGNIPNGYIGVQDKYVEFLKKAENIKEKIISHDKNYTSELNEIKYDVSDLYYLESGYDLYCEDPLVEDKAKLAYITDQGGKIYSIPATYVSKFIGVNNTTCELLTKYDELRNQIIDIYSIYSEGINNETTNHSR